MAETLEELLIRSGLVSSAQIVAARADAARTRKRLPETLIDLGYVSEQRFAEWIAQASRTPLVDPLSEEAAASLQTKISPGIAREFEVVAVRLVDQQLYVAMVNPLDAAILDVLQATTQLNVRPVTGVRSAVERMVSTLYPPVLDSPDITLQPATLNFELEDPFATAPPAAAPPGREEPFDFSNETIMRSRRDLEDLFRADAANRDADEEFGTMMAASAPSFKDHDTLPPPPAAQPPKAVGDESTEPTNPFVGIERRLDQLTKMMKKLQKKLDDLDAMLAHIVNR